MSSQDNLTVIRAHLEAVAANRPSITLTKSRSSKGAHTLARILTAAEAIFVRDGHNGLSLRKVANKAGLSVGNVTYYFKSKRSLLEAMLREALANYIVEHLKQLEQQPGDPVEILLDVVTFYVRDGRQAHPFFFQLWGYAGADADAKTLARELYRSIGYFIRHLVAAANPNLSNEEIKQAVLQIFSLEEGIKLFLGLEDQTNGPLKSAEEQARALTLQIIKLDAARIRNDARG